MSATSLDDTAMTSNSTSIADVKPVLRLRGAKSKSRFLGLSWKSRSSVDKNASKNSDNAAPSSENKTSSQISNGFFKNIKKRLRMKYFGLCKTKVKGHYEQVECSRFPHYMTGMRRPVRHLERVIIEPDAWLCIGVDVALQNEAEACWESYSTWGDESYQRDLWRRETESERELRLECESGDEEVTGLRIGSIAEPQWTTARESIEDGVSDHLSSECKAKVNLPGELIKLSKYGWYWGPISGDEADSKLISEPDGAFLVRDSSDDRYLLTLSFKSAGRLLHARMDHSGGFFSLCNQTDNVGFTSVAELIDHSMHSSKSAVFCYSRPRYPGHPSFPVRLTKPVSRFTQVRSLQYLCRFVIRQYTRLDNIHKLPLPKTIRGYIEEAHY